MKAISGLAHCSYIGDINEIISHHPKPYGFRYLRTIISHFDDKEEYQMKFFIYLSIRLKVNNFIIPGYFYAMIS